jgi:hypothetical protein
MPWARHTQWKTSCRDALPRGSTAATLFIIVNIWNQPRCPSMAGRAMWCIYMQGSIVSQRRMSFIANELEDIVLCEISQTQKDKATCWLSYLEAKIKST